MACSLQINGLAELRRALRSLASEAPRLVAPILTDALRPVARRMAAEAPEDSGALSRSIRVVEHAPRAGACLSEATATESYAAHVDLGTHDNPADDYLGRAFDATSESASARAEREITRAFEDHLRA